MTRDQTRQPAAQEPGAAHGQDDPDLLVVAARRGAQAAARASSPDLPPDLIAGLMVLRQLAVGLQPGAEGRARLLERVAQHDPDAAAVLRGLLVEVGAEAVLGGRP